jgi:ABC-type nickel/cobalt efflux system permease component RcnA
MAMMTTTTTKMVMVAMVVMVVMVIIGNIRRRLKSTRRNETSQHQAHHGNADSDKHQHQHSTLPKTPNKKQTCGSSSNLGSCLCLEPPQLGGW